MGKAVRTAEKAGQCRLPVVPYHQVLPPDMGRSSQKAKVRGVVDLCVPQPERGFGGITDRIHEQAHGIVPDKGVVDLVVPASGPQPNGSPLPGNIVIKGFQAVSLEDHLVLKGSFYSQGPPFFHE